MQPILSHIRITGSSFLLATQEGMAAFIMLIGLIMIIFILLRRWTRQMKQAKRQRRREPLTAPRHVDPGKHEYGSTQSALADTESRLEVKLHEMARDVTAQLDSKISIARTLIQDADRAANRLETVLESLRATTASMNTAGQSGNSVMGGPTRTSGDSGDGSVSQSLTNLKDAISGLAGLEQTVGQMLGHQNGQAAPSPPGNPSANNTPASTPGFEPATYAVHPDMPEASPPGPSADSIPRQTNPSDEVISPEQDPRYGEIYTLADYGFEPLEIANRVGIPVGKVQLILGLRMG